MKAILDTHALLWLVDSPEKLPEKVISLCENENNELFISIASFWELSIKISIGKIQLGDDALTALKQWCYKNSVTILPISISHCNQIQTLPFHHRDPFDRLIIAQAICEQLTAITIDEQFLKYDIDVVWK